MKRFTILLILSVFVICAHAQNFSRPGDWKKWRKELYISAGTSNFLGDLGGRDRIGTDYSPVDLDFPVTKSAFGLGYRYKLQRWLNVSSKFNFAFIRGDDKLTAEPYRQNRNLNFKSKIFELSGRIEIGYQSNKSGNRYGIKKTLSRRMKNNNQNLFFFAGIGGFYFNPKGQTANGVWVKLHPLHTEGQGLEGGPKQYKRVAVCMPLGVYYKVIINKKWSFGAEFAYRKTWTDYIDDVATTYYDNSKLLAAYGPLSAQMADPSLGAIPGATMPDASGVGAQRGDDEYDSYVTLEVTFGYIFKQKRRRSRLRSKF